jgi:glycosyltransferase involved in cell wall biosynthesis
MVGRLVPKKDPLLSIQAFTEVARVQRVELHVVGDGPLLQEARQLAVDLGIRKLVHFHGALGHTAVQEHFKHADIFLQHSRTDPQTGDTEGLPVAILEAMAHGLPVVSTNHAGIPEAVINGETGLLVEEGDLKGMVGSLLTLVSDTGLRQRLGSAARARTAAKFSWRTERRQLLKTLGLNAPDDEVANAGP